MTTPDYDYQFQFETSNGDEHLFELDTHCRNNIGEPRVRWRTEDGEVAGRWGSLKYPGDHTRSVDSLLITMEVSEPTLVFGRFEDARPTVFGMPRQSISLPDGIGADLLDELKSLGGLRQDDEVTEDPFAFPAEITDPGLPYGPAKWERVGWDSTQRVMWYKLSNTGDQWSTEWDHEAVTSPRPYQIEHDKLIWRKYHIIGVSGSKQEIRESLDLQEVT